MESKPLRMTNEMIRSRVVTALGGSPILSLQVTDVLATLGLKDWQAAVERGARSLASHCLRHTIWEGLEADERETFADYAAIVLEAALTATEEGA